MLVSFPGVLSPLQARSQWAGGVTNHQDAFLYIMRILLGLYALAPSQGRGGGGEAFTEEMAFALSAFTEMPLNPLVCFTP